MGGVFYQRDILSTQVKYMKVPNVHQQISTTNGLVTSFVLWMAGKLHNITLSYSFFSAAIDWHDAIEVCSSGYDWRYIHDDVIKRKHFPRNWPFVREIHRSPVNFPHKGQWRGALMFSLIYAWINDWVNNREAGDLRRQHGHYDVIVMLTLVSIKTWRRTGEMPLSNLMMAQLSDAYISH